MQGAMIQEQSLKRIEVVILDKYCSLEVWLGMYIQIVLRASIRLFRWSKSMLIYQPEMIASFQTDPL